MFGHNYAGLAALKTNAATNFAAPTLGLAAGKLLGSALPLLGGIFEAIVAFTAVSWLLKAARAFDPKGQQQQLMAQAQQRSRTTTPVPGLALTPGR